MDLAWAVLGPWALLLWVSGGEDQAGKYGAISPKWMVKAWFWIGWSRNCVKRQRAPPKLFEGEDRGSRKTGQGGRNEPGSRSRFGSEQALSDKELGNGSVLGFGGSAFGWGTGRKYIHKAK